MTQNKGCKIAEKKIFPTADEDTVESTNNRIVVAPKNPRKKNATPPLGDLRKRFTRLPRKRTPNQIRQELRERAVQRFKLKRWSPFIRLLLIRKSAIKVKKRKVRPKVIPNKTLAEEKPEERKISVPPSEQDAPSRMLIVVWEGSEKREEYRLTTLLTDPPKDL
jgi:hypothetical protein